MELMVFNGTNGFNVYQPNGFGFVCLLYLCTFPCNDNFIALVINTDLIISYNFHELMLLGFITVSSHHRGYN